MSFIADVHLFNMRYFREIAYLYIGLTGFLTGYFFYEKDKIKEITIYVIFGVFFGVIYHLHFADGFYFRMPSINGFLILIFQALAPLIYTGLLLWLIRYVRNKVAV